MRPTLARSRRQFFRTLLAAPVAFAAAARALWSERPAGAATRDSTRSTFPPTPDCGDDDEPTPTETEGPFYKPRSPLRSSLLEPETTGTRLVLTGRVFSRQCRPLPGVLVDFWHADDGGVYDNAGFKLRGHQFTDAAGRYRLDTIVPGVYAGRTRHIHVKVQAPGGRVLTTQLYFPNEARNRQDGLFRPDLLVTMQESDRGKQARFHFVLDRA